MSEPISRQIRWDVLPDAVHPFSYFDSLSHLNKVLATKPHNRLTMAQLSMSANIGGSVYIGSYIIRLISFPCDEPLIGVTYQKDAMMSRMLKTQ